MEKSESGIKLFLQFFFFFAEALTIYDQQSIKAHIRKQTKERTHETYVVQRLAYVHGPKKELFHSFSSHAWVGLGLQAIHTHTYITSCFLSPNIP